MANGKAEGIPSVDISAFTSNGDFEARQSTANKIAYLLSLHGCLAVSGHGITADCLDQAFDIMERFFGLPLEEKMKAPLPESFVPYSGYLAEGREMSSAYALPKITDEAERAKISKIIDYKETYNVSSETNLDQNNVWLPDRVLPGFRPSMMALYWQMTTVATQLLEAFMMSQNLPEDECEELRKSHPGYHNSLRIAHYLPPHEQKTRNEDGYRLAPHCDISTFTLLFQKDQGGLEFENKATGEWMPATPKQGYLYLNIGDVGERLFNGRYPSARHRVVEPTSNSGNNVTSERFSIPFFVISDPNAIIAPLPSLSAANGNRNDAPTTAEEMSKETYSLLTARTERKDAK